MGSVSSEPPTKNSDEELKLPPVMRVAIKAVLSDTIEEFSLLYRASSCGATVLEAAEPEEESSTSEMNSDALIRELNKIFFETLIRFEKCRREDYVSMPDGSFRKLSDDESTLRRFLQEIELKLDVLRILEQEIDKYGTFKSLRMHCDDKQAVVDMPVKLAETIMNEDQMIRFLQEKTRLTSERYERQIDFYDEVISKLKHEWQEARQISSMSYKYLKSKYKQEADFYDDLCENESRILANEAFAIRQQLNAEKRLIYEVTSCLCAELDTQTNRIRYLQERTDVQELNAKLEAITADLENLRNEHERLRKEYAKCEQVVLDNRAVEERKQHMEAMKQKVLVAIFQVQAWWRTMIVVKGIKVKPTKKGKKGKKSKNKSEAASTET